MNKKQELRIKNQGLNKILTEIIEKKKKDLALQKREIPLSKMKDFVSNLDSGQGFFKKHILGNPNIALIAEIKLATPANPSFEPSVNIIGRASEYEEAGADAISYISEKYFFKGDVAKIQLIKANVTLPVLQKDFVIDEYQIYEAKIVGSDALLLIAGLVTTEKLKKFVKVAREIGIEPVVEVNTNKDLEKAKKTTANIIAVNARDLETFEVDVEEACRLMKKIPDKFIKLGFSGISSPVEIKKYKQAGARGVLVGTSLMKARNIKEFINSLKL